MFGVDRAAAQTPDPLMTPNCPTEVDVQDCKNVPIMGRVDGYSR